MIKPSRFTVGVAVALSWMTMSWLTSEASAAQCGNSTAGFEEWKRQFADEARARGVGASAIGALMGTSYSTAAIAADRGQRSFHLSLDQFMAKRGGSVIISRGRALKQSEAGLFASIQQRYGVPPGPLLAIWGMETGFGREHGNQNALSAVATLAYDCRRSAYFTDQLYAALTLIGRGALSPSARGSMAGEIGQTQFLPKTILSTAPAETSTMPPAPWPRRRISSRPMAGRQAPDTSLVKPILGRSRHGMPRRSINEPLR